MPLVHRAIAEVLRGRQRDGILERLRLEIILGRRIMVRPDHHPLERFALGHARAVNDHRRVDRFETPIADRIARLLELAKRRIVDAQAVACLLYTSRCV